MSPTSPADTAPRSLCLGFSIMVTQSPFGIPRQHVFAFILLKLRSPVIAPWFKTVWKHFFCSQPKPKFQFLSSRGHSWTLQISACAHAVLDWWMLNALLRSVPMSGTFCPLVPHHSSYRTGQGSSGRRHLLLPRHHQLLAQSLQCQSRQSRSHVCHLARV